MSFNILEYELIDDYLHNWLVVGPAKTISPGADSQSQENGLPPVNTIELPQCSELADFVPAKLADISGKWRYFRCREDHLVNFNFSTTREEPQVAWAYSHFELSQPCDGQMEIACSAPCDVWLNGRHLLRLEGAEQSPQVFTVSAEQNNDLLVRLAWSSVGKGSQSFSARIANPTPNGALAAAMVRLQVNSRYPNRHRALEEAFEKAYLDRRISYQGKVVNLHWTEDAPSGLHYAYQMQDVHEKIYVEGTGEIDASKGVDVGHPFRIFERPYRLVLRAPNKEYFDMGLRYQREIPIYVIDNAYSDETYGGYGSRRTAALEDAARRSDDLFAEIAKMALGEWEDVDWKVVSASCESVSASEWNSEAQLLGLLGIFRRYAEEDALHPEVKDKIHQAALAYRHVTEAEGLESRAAMKLACAVLAGQLFPDSTFTQPGISGKQLQQVAGQSLLALLRTKGIEGFAEWGSSAAYEQWVVALAHLAGVADDETLSELSAVLLDKLLFLLAAGSQRGMQVMPTAQATFSELKSGQLQPTSGIQRLLWGMGVFHRSIQGVVSLACAEFEFPSFFADVANADGGETLSRESHLDANLVLYKTPDYSLASVQDYRPGQAGSTELTWRASMGTEAVVFTNHPASMYDDEHHSPGFWLGNATLPRIAQHNDLLIALYRLSATDRLGFTHAHFPLMDFDEYRFEEDWAFARKGNAYLAIHAKNGFELVKHGVGAFTELRSFGNENGWICLMGRKDRYQDFRGFEKKILKMPVDWQNDHVSLKTPAGDEIGYGWTGPLTINGKIQPQASDFHIQNPMCTVEKGAISMDIQHEGIVLRLNFE